MKTSYPVTSSTQRHSFGRNLLGVLQAIILFGITSRASAENHAVIPGATVLAGSPVAVDSAWHYIYTLNASSQVQVTWYGGGQWNTATLGSAPIVAAGGTNKLLYVDPVYHFVYYVGTDARLHCWLFNGSAWVNVGLLPGLPITDVVGVDSSTHVVWVRAANFLMAVYYNGSAWTFANTGVTDYNGDRGGDVDTTSHALYWSASSNPGTLRALVYTGRFYAPVTLDADSYNSTRPAVHQGTGEVYSNKTTGRIYRLLLNSSLAFSHLDAGAADDIDGGYADMAVSPVNGKLFYRRSAPSLVTVLTPSGSGAATTWTRTDVAGASGQVQFCALDAGYGWYVYTDTGTALHIVF